MAWGAPVGWGVTAAGERATAAAARRASPPDLGLLDRLLPDEDGLELCRRARPAGDVRPRPVAPARRGAAVALALPTMAVIPRPIAAGVLGMARLIGLSAPRAVSNAELGVPAALARNTVAALPRAALAGTPTPSTLPDPATAGPGIGWVRVHGLPHQRLVEDLAAPCPACIAPQRT